MEHDAERGAVVRSAREGRIRRHPDVVKFRPVLDCAHKAERNQSRHSSVVSFSRIEPELFF